MKNLFLSLFATMLLVSCSNDDGNQPGPNPPAAYEDGVLITNEGPFNNGSGTITYVSNDFATVEQTIYRTVNGTDLGNIVQSMGFQDDQAYIVVSNSQKIEIANRYTFEATDSITTGLENPRYFVAADGVKGYVSDWGDPNDNSDDYIAVVDLRTNEVSATIPVPFGPEKMVANAGKIYVAHQGGFGQNNVVSVISGNSVLSGITVGDVPNSLLVSGDVLYVLCGGNPAYTGNETAGSLVKIDLTGGQASETLTFGTTQHPSALTINGDKLYYNLDGKVYELATTATTLPGADIINGNFYALKAHDGMLYATDAGDFASRGSLKVFDLSTNQEIQDIQTGIVPGGIFFND